MLRTFIILLFQLVIVAVSVQLAIFLTEEMWLVPRALRKQSPVSFQDAITILTILLFWHGALLVAIRVLNKETALASFRRFLVDYYGALVATSLAASTVFLFTVVPFSANYFAWVFVLVTIGYALLLIAASFLRKDAGSDAPARSPLGLIISLWTVLVFMLVASPAGLAILYKKNTTAYNAINGLRAKFNVPQSTTWALRAAFPGKTFEQPMSLAFEPGRPDNVLVLARPGRLVRYTTSPDWSSEVLLDISEEVARIDIELGAYNFALHPDFNVPGSENAGFVYLYYTHFGDDGMFNRLVRFDLSLDSLEQRQASRLALMDLKRRPTGLHNGGGLFFGRDGFLYLSLGDFGANVKNKDSGVQRVDRRLTSGIFRIDVDQQGGEVSAPIRRQPEDGTTANYFIPLENPWYGVEGALEEFWAIGFRNPWRMSQDPFDDSIWMGDVGVDLYEEISRVEMGGNGQWPYMEGPVEFGPEKPAELVGTESPPVYYYKQTALARAIFSGRVYTGQELPGLRGLYLFGDNQAATIYAFDPEDPMNTVQVVATAGQYGQLGMTGMYADENGEIYITLLGGKDRPSGEIVRLVSASDAPQADLPQVSPVDLTAQVDDKYLSMCSRCHGVTGLGEPDVDLGDLRPDFTSASWQNGITDAEMIKVIVEGGGAVGKSEQMPGWGDFFDDAEMRLLVAKLRGFGG